jgi:hypothetical protein
MRRFEDILERINNLLMSFIMTARDDRHSSSHLARIYRMSYEICDEMYDFRFDHYSGLPPIFSLKP